MDNIDIVNKSLNTILKKGDLYDTIATRKGVKTRSHSFIKTQIFLFSRILYSGVLIYEKIKSLFSPIEEVKNAQDQIREVLGISVDIVRSKKDNILDRNPKFSEIFSFLYSGDSLLNTLKKNDIKIVYKPYLALLYENKNTNIGEYIKHLRKILSFCELHKLDEILLNVADITDLFATIDLDEFKKIDIKTLLCEENRENPNYNLLCLNQIELQSLIKKLEVLKMNKKTLINLRDNINDQTIGNAINFFLSNGDLEKLKSTVKHRLTLHINSENTYKDKEHGKINESAKITDDFIHIIASNNKGEVVSNSVISLYEYLGIPDFESLSNKANHLSDDKELFSISKLYLYLYNHGRESSTANKNISFYDRIFNDFKVKGNKKIPGLDSKFHKLYKNTILILGNLLITMILFLSISVSTDLIHSIVVKDRESTIYETLIHQLLIPYKYALNIEKPIYDLFLNVASKLVPNGIAASTNSPSLSPTTLATTGDASDVNGEMIVGRVNQLMNSEHQPIYFAGGYSYNSFYDKGQMNYSIPNHGINLYRLVDEVPLFEVITDLNKSNIISTIINNNKELFLSQSLYPVGENYVLTEICIVDKYDESKQIIIDYYRIARFGRQVSDEEISLLCSMNSPEIHCKYGISNYHENTFTSDIYNYSSDRVFTFKEIREAITTGLNLDENATIEEIYATIQSKSYSKTPIKDAGLTKEIKKMNEKEFFECIASLDSTICNLAATLAVEIDQSLIYTVGYLNYDDNYIRQNEAHAWAMKKGGEIIDITPADPDKENVDNIAVPVINSVISWGLANNIPLYALIILVSNIICKKFGKKIKFILKVKATEKVLNNPNTDTAYAKIKEILYGGTNIPFKRSPLELIDALDKELGGVSADDLKEMKKQLLNSSIIDDKDILRETIKLADSIPFIRENEDVLKLELKNKSE